ncbi:unnamed protein product [Caenorhabditis brenneri]
MVLMILTYLLLLCSFSTATALGPKVIKTSYGKLQGITYLSDPGNPQYIFKSIPFAKPPVGDLRFALPRDPEPWNDIRDATEYSAACMSNFTMTRFRQKKISEDCLYLNIFTSEKCLTKKCAVIVYFHEGAYRVDSAVMFPDQFILERYVSEDVIFVLPAYRLGVFGQLYFGRNGELSENLLVHDAVKALHYVHNEISNFGGNPKRVTLMGHSAGATLIFALGFSKLVDPNRVLFQQIISFSAHGEFGFYDLAIDNSFELAQKLGCISHEVITDRSRLNITDTLKCLRKIDKIDVMKTQSEIVDADRINFKSIIRGAPFMVLNGKFEDLKANPPARNILCGTTELEFRNDQQKMYAAGTFMDFENPRAVVNHYYELVKEKNLLDPLSSGVYISARTYSKAMSDAGANAYIYETRQKPSSEHTTDMQYFIGIHREKNHTSDMDILDSFYSKMLVNFTKTGVPSPELEKFDAKRMNYLELKVDSELNEGPVSKERYHDEETKFWFGPVTEYDKHLSKLSEGNEIRNSVTVANEKSEGTSIKDIFDKWWFYLIVLTVFALIILAFVCRRKSKNDEEISLLR